MAKVYRRRSGLIAKLGVGATAAVVLALTSCSTRLPTAHTSIGLRGDGVPVVLAPGRYEFGFGFKVGVEDFDFYGSDEVCNTGSAVRLRPLDVDYRDVRLPNGTEATMFAELDVSTRSLFRCTDKAGRAVSLAVVDPDS